MSTEPQADSQDAQASMPLDDKLRLAVDPDNEHTDEYQNEKIAQIHQAYKEAGEWVHVNATQETQAAIANTMLGNKVMTGQEWYERFRREYKMRVALTDNDTEQDIMLAAKRASNITEGDAS